MIQSVIEAIAQESDLEYFQRKLYQSLMIPKAYFNIDNINNCANIITMCNDEKPYLLKSVTTVVRKYNPKYGDQRDCECGHPYERHFDSYESMAPVGCKYCQCYEFKEKKV